MKSLIFTLICLVHIIVVAYANPVKKAGVNFEDFIEISRPKSSELSDSNEHVIFVDLETLKSGSQEIPLDFLAKSNGGSDESSEEEEESESESISDEFGREKTTGKPSQDTDENGTCPTTLFPGAPEIDSDENGTCPATLATTEEPEEEEQEVPKIIITKFDNDDDDSTSSDSSSEEVDWIITPFLPLPDIPNMKPFNIQPPAAAFDFNSDSDEEAFNLIDSNDLQFETKNRERRIEKDTQTTGGIQQKFSSFIDAIMNSFAFAV